MPNLAAERRERVLAVLPNEGCTLEPLTSIVTNMFPKLHMVELRHSFPGRPRVTAHHCGKNTCKKGGGKSPEAMKARVESDEPGEDMPEADDPEDVALDDVQGVIRDDLEALAAELDEANGEFPLEDTAALDAKLRLAEIPEALEAVRDARRKIGRGRSFGRGQGRRGNGESRKRVSVGAAGGDRGRAFPDNIFTRGSAKSTCHVCAAGRRRVAGLAIPSARAATAGMPWTPRSLTTKTTSANKTPTRRWSSM